MKVYRSRIIGLIVGTFCLLFQYCAKMDAITLGSAIAVFDVKTIDTFTVQTQVSLLDPLPTSGKGTLLLGGIKDNELGTARIDTYLRFGVPDLSAELPLAVQYDSLSLNLHYTGYSYGDTTAMLALQVYELGDPITPITLSNALEDDEYPVFASAETLYANQAFAHKSQVLGRLEFLPKPHQQADTIRIKMNDMMGAELFRLARNRDGKLVNLDELIEYLKGMVVLCDAGSSSVIGLKDSVHLDIHYSYESQEDGRRISDKISLVANDARYNYHHIESDRSHTVLAALNAGNPDLDVTHTAQRSFIQGGTGIVTKIRFPYANAFVRDGLNIINKAELVIETVQPDRDNMVLPDSLLLMKANKYGTPTSLLSNTSGVAVVGILKPENDWGTSKKVTYTLNITDFITSWRNNGLYREEESLLLSLPLTKLFSSVETLKIPSGDNQPAIKLIITYTKINENEVVN